MFSIIEILFISYLIGSIIFLRYKENVPVYITILEVLAFFPQNLVLFLEMSGLLELICIVFTEDLRWSFLLVLECGILSS